MRSERASRSGSTSFRASKIRAWTNQPLAVADQILISIAPSIKLPVWAIFLGLYPPLGLVFFWITYLAFRWRWWRAGGLG